jgi:hypothetical protein
MIAGFFARGMPPGVLEPQAGGSIAVPEGKDKETGWNQATPAPEEHREAVRAEV